MPGERAVRWRSVPRARDSVGGDFCDEDSELDYSAGGAQLFAEQSIGTPCCGTDDDDLLPIRTVRGRARQLFLLRD